MNDKLEEIRIENYVIYIYFILLFIYLYANIIEVNYIKYNNEEDREKYQLLLYIVFGTSFIITLLYTIQSIKELQEPDINEVYRLKELSILANILILIATAIIIYTIYKDRNINLEVTP